MTALAYERYTYVDSGLTWRVGTGLGTLKGDQNGLGDPGVRGDFGEGKGESFLSFLSDELFLSFLSGELISVRSLSSGTSKTEDRTLAVSQIEIRELISINRAVSPNLPGRVRRGNVCFVAQG